MWCSRGGPGRGAPRQPAINGTVTQRKKIARSISIARALSAAATARRTVDDIYTVSVSTYLYTTAVTAARGIICVYRTQIRWSDVRIVNYTHRMFHEDSPVAIFPEMPNEENFSLFFFFFFNKSTIGLKAKNNPFFGLNVVFFVK